jgi:3-phenylpropionate/cinnamic acid dioxygenase small subunit
MADGHQGPGSNTMHTVSTATVEFDSDEEATARSSFMFWTSTASEPTVTSIGRYLDVFRRTGGAWKLARRTITFG